MPIIKKFIVLLATTWMVANISACDSKEDIAKSFVQKTAASNHPPQTKTFRRKVGDLDITLTYRYKDDVVLQQVAEDITPYDLLQAKNRMEAKAVMDKISASYIQLPGVSQKVKFLNNRAHEFLTIDFTQASIQQLCTLKDISIGMIITDCTVDWLTMTNVERFLREQAFSEVK